MKRYGVLLFAILCLSVLLSWSKKDNLIFELKKTSFYWQKTHDHQAYDIVIGGDSRTLYSLDPRTFGSFRTKNFSFPSNSFTPDYLEYLSSRVQPNGKVLLGITYESLTQFEKDTFFQDAKKIKSISLKLLDVVVEEFVPNYPLENIFRWNWPGPVFKNLKEDFRDSGEIDSNSKTNDNFDNLLGHYQNLYSTFPLYQQYLEHLFRFIKDRSNLHFVLFHPCFLEKICMVENQKLSSFFEKVKTLPNVTWLGSLGQNYQSIDGDHLNQEAQIRFTQELIRLIDKSTQQ